VFVDAWGGVGATAQAGGHLATFPVTEELFPFGVGGDAVFLTGALASPSGQEGQVRLDRLVGIDRLVAECDVDVTVPGDDLHDVRWQSDADGVGDEYVPAEVVRYVVQRRSARSALMLSDACPQRGVPTTGVF
jgi:hypothetical protein